MTNQRFEDIEIKLAYQEDLLSQLNTLVTNQQLDIDRLKATCVNLSKQLDNVKHEQPLSEPGQSPDHEIPPHY